MDKSARPLEPYLEQLERLPFVKRAREVSKRSAKGALVTDALVALTTPAGVKQLPIELKRSHLSRAVAEHLVTVAAHKTGLLVLAPAVGAQLGELFTRENVNFMDLAGNCHVRIGNAFLARVQGQQAVVRAPGARPLRGPAYRVLFALLADRELIHATTRTLAEASGGVSPQTASDMRARLIADRAVLNTRTGLKWAPGGRKQALDLFLFASSQLLPSFELGRFRAKQRDPLQLEAELSPLLSAQGEWRWGGGAAANRMTGYYRGDQTVIYVADARSKWAQKLPLVPDPAGNVVLLRTIGPLAFNAPEPNCVHPLLVYVDLLGESHERAREAAALLYDQRLATEFAS